MDGGPSHPGYKTADRNLARLHNGEPFANDGHTSLVKVTKWFRRRFTREPVVNELSCVSTLLHRDLRHTRKGLTILIKGRGIADHENLRVVWHGQIFLNADPSGMIRLDPQPLAGRRWSYPSCPDHRLTGD